MNSQDRKKQADSKKDKGKVENQNQNHNTKKVSLGPNTKRSPR